MHVYSDFELIDMAIDEGDMEQLKKLLSSDRFRSINRLHHVTGDSILHRAVYAGNKEIVRLLLSYGAYPKFINFNERTALLAAVSLDIWYPSENERHQNNLEIIEMLIKNGADVNWTNWHNFNPLDEAIQNLNYDVIKLLVENGANVNSNPKNIDPDFIKYRIPYLILAITATGPFICSNPEFKFGELEEIKLPICNLLLEAGYNIDKLDTNGYPAIYYSVIGNYPQITELLLNNKANPNFIGFGSVPLLNRAIYNMKSFQLTKLLLQHGADPNVEDHKHNSPLIFAHRIKSDEICNLLLEYGAYDVLRKGNKYWKPFL